MKVKVTAEDIAKGVREAETACPIALAVKREQGAVQVEVNAYLRVGEVSYRMTAAAIDFIHNFDNGEPVEPFEFEAEEESYEGA